jgi:hypothetical protein
LANWAGVMHTQWSWSLFSVILYLGAGTSVIAFLCWNIALQKLGAGRTVLFGNLIPIFSTLEAVWLLGEEITNIHIISGVLVIAGLVLANARVKIKKAEVPSLAGAAEVLVSPRKRMRIAHFLLCSSLFCGIIREKICSWNFFKRHKFSS